MKKDVVAGLGEIGLPILKLVSKKEIVVGYDLNEKLMNKNKFKKFQTMPTSLPFNAVDFFLMSCNAKDTKSSESLSPNEIK